MTKTSFSWFSSAALIVASFVFAPTQAAADNLTVSLSDGTTTVTCLDAAACDGSGLAGVIAFTSLFGSSSASLTGTGSGAPALKDSNMDLAYSLTANASGAAKTYTIMVSENNLTGSSLIWNAIVGGTQGSGSTTTFNSWASSGNTLFATTTPLCSGSSSALAVALNCSSSTAFSGNPFSVTERITINAPAGSFVASGDASLTTATPEPGAVALMSLGLIGIGAMYRRRIHASGFGRS